MRMFSRRKIAAAAAIAVIGAASIALVPASNASSGGGCLTASGGYVNVTACISASGATVYPDGYTQWVGYQGFIPSGCRVSLELYDSSGTMVSSRSWACTTSRTHWGPFAWSGSSPSTWNSVLVVSAPGWAPIYTPSKIQILSY